MSTISLVRDGPQAHEPSTSWSARLGRAGYHQLEYIVAQLNFYYFWEKRWFFLAIGARRLHADPRHCRHGLSRDGMIVLTMSVVATLLFVTEPDATAHGGAFDRGRPDPPAGHRFDQGGQEPDDRLRALHHGLAHAGGRTWSSRSWIKRIAWLIVRVTGHASTTRICFGISVVSGLLASFRRRAHRGRHDAAGRHHPDLAHLRRSAEEVRNLAAVLLFLDLLRLPRWPASARLRAVPATPS